MNQRYYSLDVFRGATVAFMILVNNQAGPSYGPLDHAPWHGLTPTDLVFPFFLFAVGNALAFVMPRFEEKGDAYFLKKVFRRTLLIFGINVLLNWFPFIRWSHDQLVFKGWTWTTDNGDLAGVRVMGVLARIALAYCGAALIVYYANLGFAARRADIRADAATGDLSRQPVSGTAAKIRGAFFIGGCLLILYWALCLFLGDPADPYSLNGYFGTAIDKAIFHPIHLYHGEGVAFDPEGLAGTMTAIVSVILGYFAGSYIRLKGKSYEMLSHLLVAAFILLLAGYCWGSVFPINKKIWTSSYTLVAAGWALATLSLLIYFIEFRESAGSWSKFFDVFGKNPLFIFVISGVVPRLLWLVRFNDNGEPSNPLNWFYNHCCKPLDLGHEQNASVLYAVFLIVIYWLICRILDKRKIYIRV
jgi:predicted acyltransferase